MKEINLRVSVNSYVENVIVYKQDMKSMLEITDQTEKYLTRVSIIIL
jgi:hypothetical protein